MKKAYIFLANGHEEVEALMVVDLLRRAGLDIATVSIQLPINPPTLFSITLLLEVVTLDVILPLL